MATTTKSTAPTTGRKAAGVDAEADAGADGAEGWHGWDEYAAFYDWENARTVGRRDVAFWRGIAKRVGGRTLELGCGTGRVLLPLAKAGVEIVGVDRSTPMLARARAGLRRAKRPLKASLVRGDIRQLPFSANATATREGKSGKGANASVAAAAGTRATSANALRAAAGSAHAARANTATAGRAIAANSATARGAAVKRSTVSAERGGGAFDLVIAPYGILQSLVRDRDLTETLRAVSRVLAPGGTFGLDLVPDVPRWQEYSRRVSLRALRGPRGEPLTLIESVRQDRARRLTMFDQEFVEGRGRLQRSYRFSLTFRTVGIRPLCRRLERHGFRVYAVLGSYDGEAWDPRADVWVILASKL